MQKDFEKFYPIDVENCLMDKKIQFQTSDYMPSYHRIQPYMPKGLPFIAPIEHTGWRDEALACQYTCALTANLNPTPGARISGPDAARFMMDATVNNIERFPVGSSKHGIMCAENGDMAVGGVILRSGEDIYEAHWLSPLINIRFAQKPYDAVLEDITMTRFVFQLIGPKSLEIIEGAAEEDFHDLKMCRLREGFIAGKKIRVLRFGMSGGLAYEVHGDTVDAKEVHRKLVEIGNKHGLRLLGIRAYMMNHTAGGSVQSGAHYMQAIPKELAEKSLNSNKDKVPEKGALYNSMTYLYNGSAGADPEKCQRNPFEFGLGKIVDFNHDFVGKKALEEYRANPKSTGVTLQWNEEDILDVYASQFRDEDPYQAFDNPSALMNIVAHQLEVSYDLVYGKDGKEIGISSGRTASPYHRAMLSLASIELPYAELGAEVYVLWGSIGRRQKKIRAIVAPTPYNTNYSNWTFDVENIPHYKAK